MAQGKHRILMMMSEVLPFGGAESFFRLLVKHLDPDLFERRVMVPKEGPMVDQIREMGVPVEVRSIVRARDLWRLPWFIGFLRKHGIRLINAHGVRSGLGSGLARKILPLKVVVTEQNLQSWRTNRIVNGIDRFIARNNDMRTAVSQAVADSMVESGACSRDKVRVIYNAIEPERFAHNPPAGRETRKRLGIPEKAFVVASAARLAPMKGFRYLIKAVPKILKAVPDVKVVIGGKGEEEAMLHQMIADLDLSETVIMPGFVADMPVFLSAADVFVLPSVEEEGEQREGLPNVLAEAMANERPVVTTDVSGNKEIVVDGVTGFVVPQKDPNGLADAVVRLFNDPNCSQFGKAGRRVVEEKFSITKIAGQYTEMFLKLLES